MKYKMRVFKIVFACYIIGLAFFESNGSFVETINSIHKIIDLFQKLSMKNPTENNDYLTDVLQKLYKNKLEPLEMATQFNIYEAPLSKEHFKSKPVVLLLGEFSTGKTSFLEYILGEKYKGAEIGPQPTTKDFLVIRNGIKNQIIDGEHETQNHKSLFHELNTFEKTFINHFKVVESQNLVLDSITFIDTPGVLPKDNTKNVERDYDFLKALKWFAHHSDRILLFFDKDKIVLCDEMKRYIDALMDYDDKFRIIFNKATSLDMGELVAAVGELEGNLGKLIKKHELKKISIVSFKNDTEQKLGEFKNDQIKILNELADLPNKMPRKKLTNFNQRVRQVLLHAYLVNYLKTEHESSNMSKIDLKNFKTNIEKILIMIKKKVPYLRDSQYDLEKLKTWLLDIRWHEMNKIDQKLLDNAQSILDKDIDTLLGLVDKEPPINLKFLNGWPNDLKNEL